MASSRQILCDKCEHILHDTEKNIKCEKCKVRGLHHACSPFKPAELKFLEINTKCIKWLCTACSEEGMLNQLTEILATIRSLDAKVTLCMEHISAQRITIEKHNNKIAEQSKVIEELTKNNSTDVQVHHQYRTRSTKQSPVVVGNAGSDNSTNSLRSALNDDSSSTVLKSAPKDKIGTMPVADNKKPKQQINDKEPAKVISPIHKNQIKQGQETDEGFTTVRRRKLTIRGKKENTSLVAAETRKWVFVSQLRSTTTEDDVKMYLSSNGINILECERLNIYHTNIAAFKVAVETKDEPLLFNEDLWPRNVIVRAYRNFRKPAQLHQSQ